MVNRNPRLILIKNGSVLDVNLGQELTIGRSYSNLLRLEGEEISRVHAIIYRRGDQYRIRDLDSKNGVFINGKKRADAVLTPNDRLQIGKFSLLFDPPDSVDLEALAARSSQAAPKAPAGNPEESGRRKPMSSTARSEGVASSVPPPPPPPDGSVLLLTVPDLLREFESLKDNPSRDLASRLAWFHACLLHGSGPDPGEIKTYLRYILTALMEITDSDRGVVVLRDHETGELRPGAVAPDFSNVAVNRVVLHACMKDVSAILCNHVLDDPMFAATKTVKAENVGAILAMPLREGEVVRGLIYLDTIGRSGPYCRADLLLLLAAGGMIPPVLGALREQNLATGGTD